MTPQEQGRFCDNCQKCVVDFTGFSDEEMYRYITEHLGESLCGRFKHRQVNRPIHMLHQPKSRLYKWIVAAGMAIALAAVQENSFAKAPIAIVQTEDHEEGEDTTGSDSIAVKGTIVDENGEPIINAVVSIQENQRLIASTVTDFDGHYSVSIHQQLYNKDLLLIVKYLGYHAFETTVGEASTSRIQMEASDILLGDMHIEHNPPQPALQPDFDKWHGGTQKTIKSYEIEKGAY